MPSNYKLMSYNTSWVLDCSSNQFNPGLSESAAIMAKMKYMEEGKTLPIENFNDMYGTYEKRLDAFRMKLSERATNYINKIGLNEDYDFIALIEQMMHLPKDDDANYDEIMVRNFDLNTNNDANANQKYGYLKRMEELKSQNQTKYDKYTIVKDNVINAAIGAAEGIAIMYKSSLVTKPFKWNLKNNPALRNATLEKLNKIPDLIFTSDFPRNKYYKGIEKDESDTLEKRFENLKIKVDSKIVDFYSDDLGPYICYENKDANPPVLKYFKSTGAADEGRPIIMAGGMNGTTMNLFVAAHGANILNLYTFDRDVDGNIITETKDGKETNKLKSVKDFSEEEKTNLFDKLGTSITQFIQNGIDQMNDKDSALSNVDRIDLFLGGDFNDALGFILTGLIENGITLNLPNNKNSLIVKFNYPDLKTRGTFGNGAGYDVLSCCANADSIDPPIELSDNRLLLGPITSSNFKEKNAMVARIDEYQTNKMEYKKQFFNPEKFGYNGDYALFGSTSDNTSYSLKVDKNLEQDYVEGSKSVIASDHLPVISGVKKVSTGGGRFRYKHTKRHRRRSSQKRRRRRMSRRRYTHVYN